jgi:hypothetical protein
MLPVSSALLRIADEEGDIGDRKVIGCSQST